MISTKDLSGLPNAERLKNFCKGLAALDIIMLEEEWSFIRHYTYNPAWRKGKEAFFATDGSDRSMIDPQRHVALGGLEHLFRLEKHTGANDDSHYHADGRGQAVPLFHGSPLSLFKAFLWHPFKGQ